MPLDRVEILLRVQRGRALGEYIQRVAGDDVEHVRGGHHVVASIVENHSRARVAENLVVVAREEAGGDAGYDGLGFADSDFLDAWVPREGARRNSAAETDTQN